MQQPCKMQYCPPRPAANCGSRNLGSTSYPGHKNLSSPHYYSRHIPRGLSHRVHLAFLPSRTACTRWKTTSNFKNGIHNRSKSALGQAPDAILLQLRSHTCGLLPAHLESHGQSCARLVKTRGCSLGNPQKLLYFSLLV